MIKKSSRSKIETEYEYSKLCFENDLSKNALHTRFYELQEKNPRLQSLINKFTTDPTRRLKSVFMSTNGQPVYNAKQAQLKGPGFNLGTNDSHFKDSTMAGREKHITLPTMAYKRSAHQDVDIQTNSKPGEKVNKKQETRKKDFVKDNKKNAFQLNRIGGFFDRKYEKAKHDRVNKN